MKSIYFPEEVSSRIKPESLISSSQKSSVFTVLDKNDQIVSIMKKINRGYFDESVIEALTHDNIPDVCTPNYYIVSENAYIFFKKYETLKEHINKSGFFMSDLLKLSYQISAAIVNLYSAGFCQLDIRPENILYNSETDGYMVCDLIFSKKISPSLIPEIFHNKITCDIEFYQLLKMLQNILAISENRNEMNQISDLYDFFSSYMAELKQRISDNHKHADLSNIIKFSNDCQKKFDNFFPDENNASNKFQKMDNQSHDDLNYDFRFNFVDLNKIFSGPTDELAFSSLGMIELPDLSNYRIRKFSEKNLNYRTSRFNAKERKKTISCENRKGYCNKATENKNLNYEKKCLNTEAANNRKNQRILNLKEQKSVKGTAKIKKRYKIIWTALIFAGIIFLFLINKNILNKGSKTNKLSIRLSTESISKNSSAPGKQNSPYRKQNSLYSQQLQTFSPLPFSTEVTNELTYAENNENKRSPNLKTQKTATTGSICVPGNISENSNLSGSQKEINKELDLTPEDIKKQTLYLPFSPDYLKNFCGSDSDVNFHEINPEIITASSCNIHYLKLYKEAKEDSRFADKSSGNSASYSCNSYDYSLNNYGSNDYDSNDYISNDYSLNYNSNKTNYNSNKTDSSYSDNSFDNSYSDYNSDLKSSDQNLSEFLSLKELYLSDNRIYDISELSKFTQIEVLILSDNEIQDLKPLTACNSLNFLDISNNPVKSIKSLKKLKNLKTLNITRCNITDKKIRKLIKKLPDCKIYY